MDAQKIVHLYPPNNQTSYLALPFVRFPPCGWYDFAHGDWQDRTAMNFPAVLHAEHRNTIVKVALV